MGISDVSIGNNFTMGELIAHQIKSARKAAGLTQEELAEKVGLATITIRQYEAGKRVPNNNAWRKIANALDVSESYILGIDKSDQALGKRLTIVRKEFNSNKGTRLSCKIDSGLYDTLAIFADEQANTRRRGRGPPLLVCGKILKIMKTKKRRRSRFHRRPQLTQLAD